MDFLLGALWFMWRHSAGFLIEIVPGWVWVIAGFLALALFWRFAVGFWKLFGWQGVLAVVVAIITLGAYRQGWLDHKTATLSGVAKDDPLFDLSPKAKPSRKQRPTIFTEGDSFLKKIFKRKD